jgi:hypothetical protein
MKTGVDATSPERVTSMARRLAPCLYLLAVILIVVPLFDAASTTLPFRPGNVQWRFGAVGLFSNTLLTPGLGYLLAVVTAVMLQHVRTQRALAILSWVAIVALAGLLVMFTLDALQTRSLVRPEQRVAFNFACITAACKMLLWMIAFYLFGRACRVPPALRRSAQATTPSILIREAQPSVTATHS